VGKYCNNPQCFKKKTTKQNRQNLQLLFSTSSILKKIKSIKIILKKDHKKIKWGNTVAIHSVLKKKTTKLNSQPAQYI